MKKSELKTLTVAELKSLARKKKITLPSNARKDELIAALTASAAPAKTRAKAKTRTKGAAKAAGRKPAGKKSAAGGVKRPLKKTAASGMPGRPRETREPLFGVEEPLMAQERVEVAKFYTGPVPPASSQEAYRELPSGYGEDQITIMARDPQVAYAYWEVTPARIEREKQWFGWDSTLCVRVYDITGVPFTGDNAQGYYDQEIADRIGSWYFGINRPGHSLAADIGLRTANGRFLTLARSNFITMPRDGVSDVIDEEWMITEEEFWTIYGIGGLSSQEAGEHWRQRRMHGLSSPGMQSRERGKK